MRKVFALTVVLLLAAFTAPAHAVPALQLDIGGGWYDMGTESIVTDATDFTLYAILTENERKSVTIDDTYYISVALYPKLTPPGADLGSFNLDGQPVAVTGDMTYGTAPMDAMWQLWDPRDLPRHGIYPTYFSEYEFAFDPDMITDTYNTADDPGGPTASDTGGSYYMGFDITELDLAEDYELHFDLYSTRIREKILCGYQLTDVDIDHFAPFSHDAETVPEPGTLYLFGIGMIGLVGLRKRIG